MRGLFPELVRLWLFQTMPNWGGFSVAKGTGPGSPGWLCAFK